MAYYIRAIVKGKKTLVFIDADLPRNIARGMAELARGMAEMGATQTEITEALAPYRPRFGIEKLGRDLLPPRR